MWGETTDSTERECAGGKRSSSKASLFSDLNLFPHPNQGRRWPPGSRRPVAQRRGGPYTRSNADSLSRARHGRPPDHGVRSPAPARVRQKTRRVRGGDAQSGPISPEGRTPHESRGFGRRKQVIGPIVRSVPVFPTYPPLSLSRARETGYVRTGCGQRSGATVGCDLRSPAVDAHTLAARAASSTSRRRLRSSSSSFDVCRAGERQRPRRSRRPVTRHGTSAATAAVFTRQRQRRSHVGRSAATLAFPSAGLGLRRPPGFFLHLVARRFGFGRRKRADGRARTTDAGRLDRRCIAFAATWRAFVLPA